ncbi:sortase B protein-sorting domain-containing protein [Paenibacillus wynnii]
MLYMTLLIISYTLLIRRSKILS